MTKVRQRGPRVDVAPAIERFVKVLETGRLTEGPYVLEFEERISEKAGRDVFAVSSGAAALDIAFEALRDRGRGAGERSIGWPGAALRVGVPTVGHWTDYASVVRAGHEVVWLPVGPDGSLDAETTELEDLDAVLWVLTGGWFEEKAARTMERRCRAAEVLLVIDASHATGDLSVLGYGDIAVASLFATKCLTSGEGGLVSVASAPKLRDLVRSLRDGGRDTSAPRTGREPWINVGTDRRMPETSAVVGLVSLDTLEARMARRRDTLARYRRKFQWYGDPGSEELPEGLRLVDTSVGLYKALVVAPDAKTAVRFREHLDSCGVVAPSGVFDIALPDMNPDTPIVTFWALGTGRQWSERHVALPFHETMPDEEVTAVCHALGKWKDGPG
jgi:perosamine synthetase